GVQTSFPVAQLVVPAAQAPPSPVSHGMLPPVGGPVMPVLVQPEAGSHASLVQTLVSSQLGGGPPWHIPPLQASPVVQALLSLHGAMLLLWTQPLAGSQL